MLKTSKSIALLRNKEFKVILDIENLNLDISESFWTVSFIYRHGRFVANLAEKTR